MDMRIIYTKIISSTYSHNEEKWMWFGRKNSLLLWADNDIAKVEMTRAYVDLGVGFP